MINCILAFIFPLIGLVDDVVVLRDGLVEKRGTVLASDESSLRLQNANDELVQIAWDQVRDIRLGSGSPLQKKPALKNSRQPPGISLITMS